MKNTIKIKAIRRIAEVIALLAVIGFLMAACVTGTTGVTNTADVTRTTGAEGTFSITDIPAEYNGKYARFCSKGSIRISYFGYSRKRCWWQYDFNQDKQMVFL